MKMEQTDCSETSEYKIHKPGNYPEENIQRYHDPLHSIKIPFSILLDTLWYY